MVENLDNAQPCPSYYSLQNAWWNDVANEVAESIPSGSSEIEPGVSVEEIDSYLEGIEELLSTFLQKAGAQGWAARPCSERLEYARSLLALPQVAQRSQSWYEQSRNVLTASEFASVLGTERAVATLAMRKMEVAEPISYNHACSTGDMGPMDWGVRFEPVVKQILQGLWGAEIQDVGRLMHPTDTHLAASPDGLILAATDSARIGRLIEIKCPVKRGINGKIPFEYWCQMQIQMEVTGIDECDYIEVKLESAYKGGKYEPPAAGSVGETYRGFIWLLQNNETLELKYAYTVEERDAFIGLETGWGVLEDIPWHLGGHFTETVSRDRAWFESTGPKREAFWEKVKEAREGTLVLAPSQKRAKVEVCQMIDD